jgi:membrane-associated phospholipid phosphatase
MNARKKWASWLLRPDLRPAHDGLLLASALAVALLAWFLIERNGYFFGFKAAQAWSRQGPPLLWECLTIFGDERVLLALGIPFFRRYPQVFWAVLLASLIGALASRGIKTSLVLPRPAGYFPLEEITIIGRRVSQFSMPSGHTVSVFAFVGVWLAFLAPTYTLPLLALAALVGFSRVAVGAHWPGDVLLGAALGLLAAWLGIRLAAWLSWGRRRSVQRGWALVMILAIATLPFDGQGYPASLPFRILLTALALPVAYGLYLRPLWRSARQGRRHQA